MDLKNNILKNGRVTTKLLLLITALYLIFQFNKTYKNLSIIEISFWDPNKTYGPFRPPELPILKHYKTFRLEGDNKKDSVILNIARIEIERQRIQKQKRQGVFIQFNHKAKYWSFIYVLNICLKNGIENIVEYGNGIFIYNFPVPFGPRIEVIGSKGY
ncbi:hypothetical protein GU926_01500 [Nibribacter ruber]|uniref:Uncharacterized protein n=1 Tax=Nibribacter ruber TaxID=2698458 RepID=A0A6P1NZY5_9BACT|nr:hypothetical protein [Nibribacter ruber]QHL86192.1 hypothetical protein GU926_01500 [Nibribacter ruber]